MRMPLPNDSADSPISTARLAAAGESGSSSGPMSGPYGGEQAQFYADDQRRIDLTYRQRCPRCRAEPGEMCTKADGQIWYRPHPERMALVTDQKGQQ